MLLIDFSIVGTIHSNPSNFVLPSNADLDLYSKKVRIHTTKLNLITLTLG